MNWASSTPLMDSKERGPEFWAPTHPSVPLNVKPKSLTKQLAETQVHPITIQIPQGAQTHLFFFFLLRENLSHCRPTHSIFKEKYGKDLSLHLEWSTSQHCRPPLRGSTVTPLSYSPLLSLVFMHLGLLALTYSLNLITVRYYMSKLLGWPGDEKPNQYSQYLPPLISVARVSPAISNRS